jgi:hypothetical protein
LFGVFLFLVKMPFMVFILLFTFVFSYLKYVMVSAYLVRLADKFFTALVSKMYLTTFGANTVETRLHGSHKDFNYLLF